MTVQIIISKDFDLSDEDIAIHLNNTILNYVIEHNWIIDNISTMK